MSYSKPKFIYFSHSVTHIHIMGAIFGWRRTNQRESYVAWKLLKLFAMNNRNTSCAMKHTPKAVADQRNAQDQPNYVTLLMSWCMTVSIQWKESARIWQNISIQQFQSSCQRTLSPAKHPRHNSLINVMPYWYRYFYFSNIFSYKGS